MEVPDILPHPHRHPLQQHRNQDSQRENQQPLINTPTTAQQLISDSSMRIRYYRIAQN
jgi:hypothetical protein